MIKRRARWGGGQLPPPVLSPGAAAPRRGQSWGRGPVRWVQVAPWPNQLSFGMVPNASDAARSPGSALFRGLLFFVLKQQEAAGRELGRQGVRVANHAPPD